MQTFAFGSVSDLKDNKHFGQKKLDHQMSWSNDRKKRPSSSGSGGRTVSGGGANGGQRERRSDSANRNGNQSSDNEQPYWKRRSSSPRQPRTPPGRPPSSSPLLRRSPSPNHYYDFDYFMRMSDRIHDDFRDQTDRELFSESICNSISGQEVILSQHKHSSLCIQWLVENTGNSDLIRKLAERVCVANISMDYLMNQSSSCVLQALIEATLKILSKESALADGGNQRHIKWTTHWLNDVGKMTVQHMDKLLEDTNGSHVMITTLEAMGGIRVGRHWSRKTMGFGMKTNIHTEIEKDVIIKELPMPFKHLLKRFAKALVIERPDRELKEIILGKATSLVQYLLFVLKVRYPELCQAVVKRLVEIVFMDDESKFAITTSSVSAYLVEAVILVASDHRLTRIWCKHLKGELKNMWKHDIANFIVQRLIDATQQQQLFSDISEELFPSLDSIFRNNRPGIGVCLSKACQKFPASQHDFIHALMKAYDCFEPKDRQIELVPLMLFSEQFSKHGPNSYGQQQYGKSDIWLHGSLMLQYIFGFEDPYKVTKSLLALTPKEIVSIANDKSGSHVIETFLQSQTVAPKHKTQLIGHLRGSYVDMANDRFGCRIVDHVMGTVDFKLKSSIMDELAANESHLNSTRNGYYLGKKAGLFHYKNRYDDWKDEEKSRMKRRREMEDLFETEPRFRVQRLK